MRDNILLDTDSNKMSHWLQYPPNTTWMSSYLESRGGEFSHTLFFGLQPILDRINKGFTLEDIMEATEFAKAHGEPFNEQGWVKMHERHKGKFPINIYAAKEGSIIPTHNALVVVESTDPEFFWVVSYLETLLLRVWYPITVATKSYYAKRIINNFRKETSNDPYSDLLFKLHDFFARGVSSYESACIGGAAHLVNFMGIDTVAGFIFSNEYYPSHDAPMSAFSIPAAEHSTMTMWGRDREADAYRNMIKQFGDLPLYAVVSDSYDIYNATKEIWGTQLRKDVLEHNGILVVRPDSGTPHEVVLKVVKLLDDAFGSTRNDKGYKLLNHARVIQGDGINLDSISLILHTLASNGYSWNNVAFGMGGALLQQCNRDTLKFAFKCSAAIVDGKLIKVSKSPVGDSTKNSKAGEVVLVSEKGEYKTVEGHPKMHPFSQMVQVFRNGYKIKNYSLSGIRSTVAANFGV